ncbi:MAG TPA: pyridoxamine 5'-phosphate oxidase family protein [Streptosporangiaceae bacterium]|nr:pyridoxamine 5'-phosphate oxidase family protein [Streptosporangiaceae bacterium]
MSDATLEKLDEAECVRLISPGGIGRLVFAGRYDLTVVPVNYVLHDGAILLRTVEAGSTDEDLRTGIEHAEYRVAFEIDDIDAESHEGWSVLIQGPAHHLDDPGEQADAIAAGVQPWAGGEREHFIEITPARITGRRIRHKPAA